MEKNPIKNDKRKASRTRVLGEGSFCVVCGYADSAGLTATASKLLEDHHSVGRNHDPDLTVALCRNCHAELTEGVRKAGADMIEKPHVLDRIIHILRALGAFFRMLGEAFQRWAQEIEDTLKRITNHFGNWREA